MIRSSTLVHLAVCAVFAAVLAVCGGRPASAAPFQGDAMKGRLLSDVLTSLQRSGLRIVFSSELVTPDMRVVAEPRGKTPRQQLDEILEPHGLKAENGPGSIIQVVRTKRGSTSSAAARSNAAGIAPVAAGDGSPTAPLAYAERVEVRGTRSTQGSLGASSEMRLGLDSLSHATGVVADDPLQAVHAMPRVAAADDFRGEFSVRGSPYRHVGVVVDGIATPWLRHTVYGRDVGSVSMFGFDSVQAVMLRAGAYAQRYGDKLGAELELSLSEGSRESTRFRPSLGGTSASTFAEGPLGGNHRGSWLVNVRHSYLGWPMRRLTQPGAGFGFADLVAKLVRDVSATEQLSVSVLAGRTSADESDDTLPAALSAGTNRAVAVNLGWRSAIGARTTLMQRASVVDHAFFSATHAGSATSLGTDRALSYRGTITRSLGGGILEFGGEIQRVQGMRDVPAGAFAGAWTTRAAYGLLERSIGPVSVAAGVRAADSSLVRQRVWSPWLRADWAVASSWTVSASAGVSHQFPELEHVRGLSGSRQLEAERATHVDVGVERRLPGSLRLQATLFARDERNVLREDPVTLRPENSLDGRSRGVELVLARDGSARVTGWVSYAYAATRYLDPVRHEIFWGDFDQRHTLNASGAYRVSDRTTMSVNLRAATGIPIPGYFAERDGRLFVSDRLNEVRLPLYARLDLRVQRTIRSFGRNVAFFAEVLNVLDRQNRAPGVGAVFPATGEAIGFTRSLVPRRPAAGIVISF